ncbi:MAG: hypothetical protein P8N28_02955, partial [Phycisphaerales bacterium]|nr:hypothetical protein [Phycisphaerales bacterium]
DEPSEPPEEPDADVPPMDDSYYGDLIDVWSVELTAGDTILVSVDTLDADTMFDPVFMVTGPDYCLRGYADDSISCTEEIFGGACPAAEMLIEEDGTHYVLVSALECNTDEATYEIGIDASTEPSLMLLADDIEPWTMEAVVHNAVGTATITE